VDNTYKDVMNKLSFPANYPQHSKRFL